MTNSLIKLVEGFRNGSISIKEYLNKLEEKFEQIEPQIFSFIPERERFSRLRNEFDNLINKFHTVENLPPLFGIPVAIKDLYHVTGFETRAGSKLPAEVIQGREGELVSKIRSSGALIFGKTVTTEFAYFAPGETRNPLDVNRTPGGSSSGSAAAVAAGLTLLALGTQTIGSIIRPAAFCGVIGFKPSQGRLSSTGIVPLSPSLDQPGFFVTDVESAKYVFRILCDDWKNIKPFNDIWLLIPEGPYLKKASSETLKNFYLLCDLIAGKGFHIETINMFQDYEEIVNRHLSLVAAEAAIVHREWYSKYSHLYHPKTKELIEKGKNISESELEDCRKSCLNLRNYLNDLLNRKQVSVFISPSTVDVAPLGIESTGDPIMNFPWTQAGLPTISLPFGKSTVGLPYGLQVSASHGNDEQLLSIAVIIEKMLKNS